MFQGRKIVTLMISVLAGVLLWLYVVTNITPEANQHVGTIPIVVDGADVLRDRGLVITGQNVEYLSLELKTSRANLSKLNSKTILVTADATRIKEPGTHQLPCVVTFPDTIRSGDVDIQRKSVEYVTVTVAQLERKSFKIQLVSIGSVKDGFLLESASAVLDPEEVVVTGPADEIAKIDRVVVEYDVSDLEDTETVTAQIRYLDEDKNEIQFSDLTETDFSEIELTLPVVRRREISLAVDYNEGGGVKSGNASQQCIPGSIVITGPASLVDALPDPLILGTIDLAEVTSNYYEKDYQLKSYLPAGVANKSGVERARVIIRLSGVTTATIPVSDIRLVNAPTEYLTEISTKSVTISVRGSKEIINQIKDSEENGFYVTVDLENYTESHPETGAFTVLGTIYNPYPDISVPGTVEIGVLISQPEEPVVSENE